MLFVLPILVVFSSAGVIGLLKIISNKPLKVGTALIYLVLMFLPVKHQAATFPADYIYFNSVSGGNKKAWSNMEYDYYFHGLKKPAEYLIELVKDNEIVVASNCNLSNYFEKLKNIEYRYCRYLERSSIDWDYGLFGVNYLHPSLLKNGKWKSTQIIKTFYHKGNPIVVLLKRGDKNDFYGISKIKTSEFKEAQTLLGKAISSDSNNVWLFVQMAKNSLKQKDSESFNRYLQNGREIYPQYEPFFLLEAQYLYNENEYHKAKEVLNELIEINHRYGKAASLLKEVDKKLKIN